MRNNSCFGRNMYSEKYLPPQILYKGMTKWCHPVVAFPCGWDVWHSSNHWSNEDAIKRYLDTITIPFVNEQCKKLLLSSTHQALVSFDGLRGQNTTEFLSILEKKQQLCRIPHNCTDKLHSLTISVNKSMKSELKKQFQLYYANEVKKHLSNNIPLQEIKINLNLSTIKTPSSSWIMYSSHEIEKQPELAMNGFRKAGILDIIDNS